MPLRADQGCARGSALCVAHACAGNLPRCLQQCLGRVQDIRGPRATELGDVAVPTVAWASIKYEYWHEYRKVDASIYRVPHDNA
jgi:hypothetical protein